MPPARSGATPSLGFMSPAPAPGLLLVVVLCRWLVGGAHCPAVLAASSVSASSMGWARPVPVPVRLGVPSLVVVVGGGEGGSGGGAGSGLGWPR